MFNILSLVFRYFFIIIIYLFIFAIIRLIYLDIKGVATLKSARSYLKLIVMKEYLPFQVNDMYAVNKSIIMGRKQGNDIVINDPYMSSEHLKITVSGKRFMLTDLGSSNGTYVNGERIEGEVELKNNDRIRLGQLEFLFVAK